MPPRGRTTAIPAAKPADAPKEKPARKKAREVSPAVDPASSDTDVEVVGGRKGKAAAKKGPAKKDTAVAVPVPVPEALKQNPFENKIYITTMVRTIVDDEGYRNKLYPGSGQNAPTAAGGGLSKANIYWEIAKLLWGSDHAEFIAWLGKSKAKEREVLTDKVKYRLSILEKTTRKIHREMHQTGAGNDMTQAELDALPEDDERRSAWGSKLVDFPWYFDIDMLLGKRPNVQPVAIGNTASDDILNVSDNEPDASDGPPAGDNDGGDTHDSDHERGAPASDNESTSSIEPAAVGSKRKRTSAKPSTSAPAQRSAAPVRKPKALDVGEMVDREAETHCQQLKLASLDATTDIERIKATKVIAQGRLEVKKEKEKRKMEEEKRKTGDADFARKLEILKAEREYGVDAVRRMFPDAYKSDRQLSSEGSHHSSPAPSHRSFPSSDEPIYSLASYGSESFDYGGQAGSSAQVGQAGPSGWYAPG
ncbi:hypothetical protein C8F01DRAFT_1257754 [Mycena amicta]|nr:hypothetical protein C8F01DRAFT_1257754 [Mycena amicta]